MECGNVWVGNFNYDYIIVKKKKNMPERFTLITRIDGVYIKCQIERRFLLKNQNNKEVCLCKILNKDELIYNEDFIVLLKEWNNDFSVREKENEAYVMSMKKQQFDDEFNDMDFISQEYTENAQKVELK